jgi:hypothetical protein
MTIDAFCAITHGRNLKETAMTLAQSMRSFAIAMTFGVDHVACRQRVALDAAQGEVLLSVTGAVTETNAGDAAEFDLAMLEGFEAVEIETTTIWTEGVQTFVGVELDDLLAAIGAEGETLRAIAANDYAVDIPVADAVDGGPIIAYLRNGEP